MPRNWVNNIVVENAEIEYPSFSGEETPNNREGRRGLNLVIRDPEQAQILAGDGWLIKHRDTKDGGNDEYDYLPVAIRFDKYPPNIYLVNPDIPEPILLTEDGVSQLPEYPRAYENIDIEISPSFWGPINGKSGIKAYVKNMYVKVRPGEYPAKPREKRNVNPFAAKYGQVPSGDEVPFDI